MDKNSKNKGQVNQTNVIENLKDIGASVPKSVKSDLLSPMKDEFIRELFGRRKQKMSGEIVPGETLEMREVFSGKYESNKKLKTQLALEKKLRQEETERLSKHGNELKLQLHAVTQEMMALVQTTEGLGREIEIAAMQAPINPGVYHIVFFEKLLEFIRSFRKKISESRMWLQAYNVRARKQNFWGTYQKHGGKFLLSGEHYLQRSAG